MRISTATSSASNPPGEPALPREVLESFVWVQPMTAIVAQHGVPVALEISRSGNGARARKLPLATRDASIRKSRTVKLWKA